MLERTAALVDTPDLVARLDAAMCGSPLPKPADHKGGSATDMFELTLERAERRRIASALAARRAAGETTREGRHLGGFVEAWQEYAELV